MSQCCARKKSNLQERCSRRCIEGSQFCGLHHNKKDIITIHEEIPSHLLKGSKSKKSPKLSSSKNNLSHDETNLLQLGDLSRVNLAKISVARLRTTCHFHGLCIKGKTKKYLALILKEFLVAMAKGNENIKQVRFLQSWIRRIRYQELLAIRGIVVKDTSQCVNTEDVITLDPIQEVPRKFLFSYQDPEDKLWYAFDIRSLLSILSKNKINPYNTKQIPQSVSLKAHRLESLLKLQGISTTLEEDSADALDDKTRNKHRVVHLFHEMDSLDQYTNPDWFLELSLSKLKKFYKELEDIWNYRLNLTKETKSHIVPPHGKVFMERIPYVLNLPDYDRVQNICLNAIERLITSAEKRSDRVNGCIYVLLALVLVNKNAAMSLPTLYSMVAPDDFLFQQQNEIAVMV